MTLGVREMARHLDCAPSLVSRYKGRGMPMTTPAAARAWMRDNVARDPRSTVADDPAAPPAAADAGDGYRDARARREQAEAELAELKLQRERGEVLDREPTVRAIVTAYRQLRDAGAVLGRSISRTLAATTDARECQRIVDRALGDLFVHFAQRNLPPLHASLAGAEQPLPADLAPDAVAERMAALAAALEEPQP